MRCILSGTERAHDAHASGRRSRSHQYRGPGNVKVDGLHEFKTTKGGKPMEPCAGKASGTVTFDKPGDYILHVLLTDFSERAAAERVAAGRRR